MLKIRYVDEVFYNNKLNTNNDILKVFATSSSSSIDPTRRALNNRKINFLELIASYIALDKDIKQMINKYFEIPSKIRDIIECKAVNPGYSQSEIAEELKISRQTLYNRINELKELGDYQDALNLIMLKPNKPTEEPLDDEKEEDDPPVSDEDETYQDLI